MAELHVRLFGKFAAERGSEQLQELATGRVNDLFCYLLLNRGRPQSREVLALELWGDGLGQHGRKYLRQALWQLQTALNNQSPGLANRLLVVEPDWIELNLGQEVWLDVAEFERLSPGARARSAGDMADGELALLQDILQLYRGELLERCTREWCFAPRDRLEATYLALLEKMVAYCEARGQYATGLMYAERILTRDRARENAHRRAMRLHYLLGDRTSALRQYERCAAALREELDVAPAAGTIRLYERIRTDSIEVQAPGTPQALAREELLLLLQLRVQESRAALSELELELKQLFAR